MMRYWQLLEASIRPGDPFECSSILSPSDERSSTRNGKALRFLTRQLYYPAKIKAHGRSGIVHILDHSWADMMRFTSRQSIKVVTVHDLIPLRFPGELSPGQLQRFQSRIEYLKRADAIIAVSNYTKREIEDLLGIDGRKIRVVFNGVELPEKTTSAPPLSKLVPRGPGDTSFHVGSIGNTLLRKNLAILPAALARLQTTIRRKVILVRVGQQLSPSLAGELRRELGDDGLIELGILPDADLAEYYAGLDVLAVPSTYEGFGLPVLEGMAAGVPVVASSSSSIPEVGGENVLYFDPSDAEAFARQLAVVAEKRLPEDWTDLAYERAKRFSWRGSLEGIYDVYHQALAEKRQPVI